MSFTLSDNAQLALLNIATQVLQNPQVTHSHMCCDSDVVISCFRCSELHANGDKADGITAGMGSLVCGNTAVIIIA